MRSNIDETKTVKITEVRKKIDQEERAGFEDYNMRAEKYIESFSWCDAVVGMRVGLFFPDILSVFLVEIESSLPHIPELVWVVIGDLPPAYVRYEKTACGNAACALNSYVGAMYEWVEAVENGQSVEGLVRVNVAPTKEWAKELRGRLEFIDEDILPEYEQFLT